MAWSNIRHFFRIHLPSVAILDAYGARCFCRWRAHDVCVAPHYCPRPGRELLSSAYRYTPARSQNRTVMVNGHGCSDFSWWVRCMAWHMLQTLRPVTAQVSSRAQSARAHAGLTPLEVCLLAALGTADPCAAGAETPRALPRLGAVTVAAQLRPNRHPALHWGPCQPRPRLLARPCQRRRHRSRLPRACGGAF